MQQRAVLLFPGLRFVLAGVLLVVLVVGMAAVITAAGAHSVLDGRTPQPMVVSSTSGSPNIVTVGMSNLATSAHRGLLAVGTTLYGGCRSITNAATGSGRALAHIGGATIHGVGSTITAIGRGVGSGVLFVFHLPGAAVHHVTSGQAVSAIIRPADDKPVPTINGETSAAVLASLNAQQQQAFALLQAAQVTANRGLGGVPVAGDPSHGGYPAAWDHAAQDSRLDSWGMYNRECVSYAAWKVYQTYGHMPYWGGVGNANEWVRDARRAGIPTGSTPKVHAVAISMRGYYGHAMWVEQVSGNMIYVSQYNYDLRGHYSEMWLSSSSLTYIYFD